MRPINVFPCILRLASTHVCNLIKNRIADMDEWETAFIKGGSETLALTVNAWMEKVDEECIDEQPDHLIIDLDLKNAFNSVSRDLFIALIGKYFDEFSPFIVAIKY